MSKYGGHFRISLWLCTQICPTTLVLYNHCINSLYAGYFVCFQEYNQSVLIWALTVCRLLADDKEEHSPMRRH